MITIRTIANIPADRQVMLSLPPEAPTGQVELVVTIAPQAQDESLAGGLRRRFGQVHGGDPRSADNERIDTDLAGSYQNPHQ